MVVGFNIEGVGMSQGQMSDVSLVDLGPVFVCERLRQRVVTLDIRSWLSTKSISSDLFKPQWDHVRPFEACVN